MSAGQLASAIGLTSGATTTAIDRLERAGYVHRRSDPTDRRRVLVVASEEAPARRSRSSTACSTRWPRRAAPTPTTNSRYCRT